ncbi:hypothetical protein, partial [Paenibacillus sp. Soil522]|uniref:hypothetical protein n=1 Tax=Paenibacillus sp. Soil522 TaxID=1736388 RepID=UPI000A8A69E4
PFRYDCICYYVSLDDEHVEELTNSYAMRLQMIELTGVEHRKGCRVAVLRYGPMEERNYFRVSGNG